MKSFSRLFVLVVGGALVVNGQGLVAIGVIYATADLVSAATLTWLAWRRLAPDEPVDRNRFRWRRLAPLGLAGITGLIYYRIDLWLLALISTAGEVANYGRLLPVTRCASSPRGSAGGGQHPVDSPARLWRCKSATDRLARWLCLALAPAVLVIEIIPEQLLRIAFGGSYAAGDSVLRILAVAVLPSAAGLVWSPLLGLRGRGLLTTTVVSLCANVALNIALIPHIGAEGAAVATVIGQCGYAAMVRYRLGSLSVSA